MKTIYFVRHAKSSWNDLTLSDHDRPLNKRGLRDAPLMASRLAELNVMPDGLLTSTARRARQTADFFAQELGIDKQNIREEKGLYHAYPDTIATYVRTLPESWNTVLLFGHNPGYTDLAYRLQNDFLIDNVPTCGILISSAPIKKWEQFQLNKARRVGFLYPKQG